MASLTGRTYAAVHAIASEVANVQLRLFRVAGDDQEEQDEHPLLDLLESPNEHMTGVELKTSPWRTWSSPKRLLGARP